MQKVIRTVPVSVRFSGWTARKQSPGNMQRGVSKDRNLGKINSLCSIGTLTLIPVINQVEKIITISNVSYGNLHTIE